MRLKLTKLRILLMSAGLLLFSSVIFAQQRSITGTVINPAGEPLIGSTVVVKGTNNGTQTNAEGKFTITAPRSNSRLVISSVGYEPQEVVVTGNNSISVT
ncbi:MAG: carboxypeptidase-like regulatory domain-containing protein, partial [Bacteroidota bacterium]|nr:carboxypeptidase-like regulatory domain-containing protein [Bacteroidota bacterium]